MNQSNRVASDLRVVPPTLRPTASTPAVLLALLLSMPAAACSPGKNPNSSDSRADSISESPASDDSLWIAIADIRGALAPIARYADGTWRSLPWAPDPSPGEVEAVNSGEGVWSWEEGPRILRAPERGSDALGRPPGAVGTKAAGVPASWSLFSDAERSGTLQTRVLTVQRSHCGLVWLIQTNRDTLPPLERLVQVPGLRTGIAGVAFSRAPDAVLSESELPDLDKVKEDLGFVDRPPTSKLVRSFRWLGFFRGGERIIGVLRGDYYEGADHKVVEITGDRGRLLAETYEGGC